MTIKAAKNQGEILSKAEGLILGAVALGLFSSALAPDFKLNTLYSFSETAQNATDQATMALSARKLHRMLLQARFELFNSPVDQLVDDQGNVIHPLFEYFLMELDERNASVDRKKMLAKELLYVLHESANQTTVEEVSREVSDKRIIEIFKVIKRFDSLYDIERIAAKEAKKAEGN